MSLRRGLRKVCAWGLLLVLAVLVGGAIAAYHYAVDSDTLADMVRREAPRFLPGCRVDVAKVRFRPFAGDVTLVTLLVRDLESEVNPMVGRADRVQIRYDPWAMFKGRLEIQGVTLIRPVIRLHRRLDGSWNFQGLLADPWPGPKGGATPPISIQDGTVELAEADSPRILSLLHGVTINIPAADPGTPIGFELIAKGDHFDRVHVEGIIDPTTGRAQVKAGDLDRLNLSDSLRNRLPAQAREALKLAGLAGGEVDAKLLGLTYDPKASPPLHYAASARLRRGIWKCEKLPFPINDVSVNAEVRDGNLIIDQASGTDGPTSFQLQAKARIDDLAQAPFECRLEASNLELDDRLRRFTPKKDQELWALYFPEVGTTPTASAGRVNVVVNLSRPGPGAAIAVECDVVALDVSVKYRHFAYPVEHIKGKLHYTPKKLTIDVQSLVGNGPLRVSGEVDNPGPNAVARLDFTVESLPVDDVLFQALPPDVRKVVDDFKPTGVVQGRAKLYREPPLKPGDDPRGRVKFDAWADLVPGCCSVTWKELKYPVRNLTGKLEIHPDLWIFKRMQGNNGQAILTTEGRVEQVRKNKFKVAMKLQAENLPFDQQLRDALPRAWQRTWSTLNPTGACDIKATIDVDPDRLPKPQHDRIVVTPREQTGVKLQIRREPRPGDPGGLFELRMDDASGEFIYDTAHVAPKPPSEMNGVKFNFHGSPVTFEYGQVDVKDDGAFNLYARNLEVSNLRLDQDLRKMMPPEMASAARRLGDGAIPMIRSDLGLGWSGKPGDSPWCRWENAFVILSRNKIEIGSDFNLEHIEGELKPVRGLYDGKKLEIFGKLNLGSVSVMGQHLTALTADLEVKDDLAKLEAIKGSILGGDLSGHVRAFLETSPRYSIGLSVVKADLHEYARSLKGHQTFKGLFTGWFNISGVGDDPHVITGLGGARVVEGDLGTLPVALRFLNALRLAKDTRTAFDEAKVDFRIINGVTTLEPVQFSGNAFSLKGKGRVDVRGDLDMKLQILVGRDSWHIPVFSDFTRELSGQILVVHVQGSLDSPTFKPEAIPLTAELFRRKTPRTGDSSLKTGLETRLKNGIPSRWSGLTR